MKASACAPANIAFIKYWGQRDFIHTLPFNDSFSMNLSSCVTTTSVQFLPDKTKKVGFIKKYPVTEFVPMNNKFIEKIDNHIHTIKSLLPLKQNFGFKIYSQNSFPLEAGIASSASFFSSLTIACCQALDIKCTGRQLSILARLSGSGSACRSIPDGFSWWRKGTGSHNSYAVSIAPPTFWTLVDTIVINSFETKKISSQKGHKGATTSPYFKTRITDVEKRSRKIREAFLKKDFTQFGRLIEEEAVSLHTVMMSQRPPLFYWSGKTIEIMEAVRNLRTKGIEAYYTIDAGQNVHVISRKKDSKYIYKIFKEKHGVADVIVNIPANGAHPINNHLF